MFQRRPRCPATDAGGSQHARVTPRTGVVPSGDLGVIPSDGPTIAPEPALELSAAV